jgi:hypothetical protein
MYSSLHGENVRWFLRWFLNIAAFLTSIYVMIDERERKRVLHDLLIRPRPVLYFEEEQI